MTGAVGFDPLLKPKKENKFRIIGIMTGTSMDGIDVSISDFEYNSNSNFEKSEFITKPKITPIAFEEFEFDHNYKSKIKSLINESTHIKYISALNFYKKRGQFWPLFLF